jgi:hypothetical protein
VGNHADDSHDGRLNALEPAHVDAFRAFQRPAGPADQGLSDQPAAAHGLGPELSRDLARRVYDGPEGTIDLVPGPGAICCVARNPQTGERMAGTTSTELAAHGTHGFIRSGPERYPSGSPAVGRAHCREPTHDRSKSRHDHSRGLGERADE